MTDRIANLDRVSPIEIDRVDVTLPLVAPVKNDPGTIRGPAWASNPVLLVVGQLSDVGAVGLSDEDLTPSGSI